MFVFRGLNKILNYPKKTVHNLFTITVNIQGEVVWKVLWNFKQKILEKYLRKGSFFRKVTGSKDKFIHVFFKGCYQIVSNVHKFWEDCFRVYVCVVCVSVCVCVCVRGRLRSFTVKASCLEQLEQINDVLKTSLSFAESLHRYFRM